MSALGQKQTSHPEISMSALPPKADIASGQLDVCFVPIADIRREEIRSGNFSDRAGPPRDNALAIAADIRPPLVQRSYTIPESSLASPGDCVVATCAGVGFIALVGIVALP